MGVSIVMPVYNEEKVIEKVVWDYYAEVVTKIEGSEFIVVNDGSTDSTPEILRRLKRELPQLRIINLEQNNGHGKALWVGFNQVENPLIFHVDSDDQFRTEDFWKLYRVIEKNDIVSGCRIPRRDPFHRKIISSMVRLINAVVFGMWIRDINSPFKFIKTSVFQDVIKNIPMPPFALSLLILILAKHKRYQIAEVPVAHYERKTGKSTLTRMYLLKACFICLTDILKLKKRLLYKKFSKKFFDTNIIYYGKQYYVKITKILLVMPNSKIFKRISLGLLYIASSLRKESVHHIKIVDAKHERLNHRKISTHKDFSYENYHTHNQAYGM